MLYQQPISPYQILKNIENKNKLQVPSYKKQNLSQKQLQFQKADSPS